MKKYIALLLTLCMLLALVGCGNTSKDSPTSPPSQNTPAPSDSKLRTRSLSAAMQWPLPTDTPKIPLR